MKYLAVLGRQAEISLAELTALFGEVKQNGANLAVFEAEKEPEIARLGGTMKIASELEIPPLEYLAGLPEGKITLGISDYSPGATKQKTMAEALKLKKILARKKRGVRIVPNIAATISTAASHHNQLGEKKNHVELMKTGKKWWVLTGVQNITAYARRDQARPARDAKVGMLPPKLAQILINLCGPLKQGSTLLDPFCGTGVVLQEALLMGYKPLGSDIEPRMVEYTGRNLEWGVKTLKRPKKGPGEQNAHEKGDFSANWELMEGDATSVKWGWKIDAVACECYLGRPMSLPPAEIKLKEEKQRCGSIILGFLKNLQGQIPSSTPVAIAVPAWLRPDGSYARLGIIDEIEKMGYNVIKYKFARSGLLYHREGQVVAREIIVLRKK